MKLKQTLLSLCGFVMLTALTTNLHAQVTIGSGEVPVFGALLQLKNIEGITDGSANATKGIMMPRVALSTSTELYPLSSDTPTDAILHVGSIIYNTTMNDTQQNRLCKGMHVWTGVEWTPLIPYPIHPATAENAPKRSTVESFDGFVHETVWIGDGVPVNVNQYSCDPNAVPEPGKEIVGGGYGAWWTAVNMMSTLTQSGTKISIGTTDWPLTINPAWQGVRAVPNPNPTYAYIFRSRQELEAYTQTFSYKETLSGTTNTYTMTPLQYAKKFGIKYTYEQAMKACPKGWFIPTVEDMGELADYYLKDLGLVTPTIKDRLLQAARYMKGENIEYTSQDGVVITPPWNTENPHAGKTKPLALGLNIQAGGHVQPSAYGIITDVMYGGNFLAEGFWISTVGANYDTRSASASMILARDGLYGGLMIAARCMKKDVAENVDFVYDREGNSYMTASFGPAGRWMVQNLRTKFISDGSLLTKNVDYKYPGGDVTPSPLNNEYLRFSHGFVYTWGAASGRSTAANDQGNSNHAKIQGVCPNGWHLPTDKEWSELEKVLNENTHRYSEAVAPLNTWTEADYTGIGTGGRTGLGVAFVSKLNEVGSEMSVPIANAKSLRAERGGFDAQPLGAFTTAGVLSNFGERAFFWSSSAQSAANAWSRDFTVALNSRRYAHEKGNYMSVRCVQD